MVGYFIRVSIGPAPQSEYTPPTAAAQALRPARPKSRPRTCLLRGGGNIYSMLKSKFIRSLVWPILSFIVYGIFRNPINNILAPSFWSIVDIKEGLWLDYSMLLLSALLFVSGWRN